MSETTDRPLTVKQARRLLSDTRAVSTERVHEAQMLLHDLQSRRPGILPNGGLCVVHCKNCGCSVWTLHTDDDDERWACDRCHREPMSQEEARALKDAQRAQADRLAAEKAAEEAARPSPRQALSAVAAELAKAQAELFRMEAGADAARERLAEARVALDSAEEGLLIARNRIGESAVERCFDTAAVRKPSRGVAAEMAGLEEARIRLEAAAGANQSIADMLSDAGVLVRKLEQRHREAGLAVLSDECAPLFIARASTARTEFIAASKGLQWLERAGAAPNTLIGAELRWSWHHSPEVWNAGSQSGPDLDTALKALLRDPRAPVGEWA
jgi:hypothetical protein